MSGFLFKPDTPYKSPMSLLEKLLVITARKSSNGRSYYTLVYAIFFFQIPLNHIDASILSNFERLSAS